MGITGMFRHWQDIRRTATEIASIDDADLAGLGVTRAELMEFAQMPQEQVARMERMAAVFGVVQRQLNADPDTRNDIVRRCLHCGAQATCTQVLNSNDGVSAAECGFCPNAETYTALAG